MPGPEPLWAGSHPPQEEVVRAVVTAHGLAAAATPAAESEVLVAVASADNQHFGPGRGGSSGPRGVPVLQRRQLLGAWGRRGRVP